jgi:hypothetical protein
MVKEIELVLKVKVEVKDFGEMLTCSDPETFPLVGYGFAVQDALAEKLGWNEGVSKELMRKAKEETKGSHWYTHWVNLAQEWAVKRLKEIEE